MIPECENGCGRRVSANKRFCMTCIERMAHLQAVIRDLKNEEPMENCTHILIRHKNVNGVDTEDLYRANGMLCASRQKDIVRFGTDISTAQNRPFLNTELASAFMRVMAEVDLKAQEQMLPLHEVIDTYVTLEGEPKAIIEERDAERAGIIMPVARRII